MRNGLRARSIRKQALAERARRLGPATFFFGLLPLLALIDIGSTIPPFVISVLAGSVLICAWCWVRLPSTGIRIDGDRIVVTSWWRTRTYEKAEIVRFREEAYMGYLFVAGWTVYGGQLESGRVVAKLRNGDTARLHGSVCNRRTARRTSEALNRWLGAESGAGTGPRRSARARRDGAGPGGSR